MIDTLNAGSAAWASLCWAIVWQSSLLAGAVAIAARGLRRAPPEVRYWLWQAVAIKLLIMPFWIVPVGLPAFSRPPTEPIADRPPTGAAPLGEAFPRRPFPWDLEAPPASGLPDPDTASAARFDLGRLSWKSWAMLIWLGGIGLGLATLIRQHARLSRHLAGASPMTDPAWRGRIEEAAQVLGLPSPPRTLVTPGDGSPFVCGLVRPTLVIPESLVASLEPIAARRVLLHELAHLKRRDLIWGWLPEIARRVFWFHPVAHLAHSDLDPVGYAGTLVRVVAGSDPPSIPDRPPDPDVPSSPSPPIPQEQDRGS
jgi:Zn-dependent protease with chaperone function